MTPPHARFLKNLLLFSGILALIFLGASFVIPKQFMTPSWPYQVLFFVSITILTGNILIKALQDRFRKFFNVYLLITTIRLFLFLAIIIGYLNTFRSDAAPFALMFFLLYLCFSGFEVAALVSISRKPPQ